MCHSLNAERLHNSKCSCCLRIEGTQGNRAVDMAVTEAELKVIGDVPGNNPIAYLLGASDLQLATLQFDMNIHNWSRISV